MVRSRRCCIAIVAAVGLWSGCSRSRTVGSDPEAATGRYSCDKADVIRPDRRSAIADLECSGELDTVKVAWDSTDHIVRPLVVVTRPERTDRVRLATEGLPEIVAIGDVDGDGIRDILLVTSDESTVIPGLVIVRRDSAIVPVVLRGFDWKAFQYVFADNVMTATCLPSLRPRIVSRNGGAALSVASGSSLTSDCRTPPRKLFQVAHGVLEPIR